MENLPKSLRNAFSGAMEEYKYFEWSMKGQADTLTILLTWTMLDTSPMEKTIPSELQGAIQGALDDYKYFDWSIIGLEGMIKMSLTWKTKNEGCSDQYEIRHPEGASTAATQHRPAEPRTHALSGFSMATTGVATSAPPSYNVSVSGAHTYSNGEMIKLNVKDLTGWQCVITLTKNATIKDLYLVIATKKEITLSEEEKKDIAALVSSGNFIFRILFGGQNLQIVDRHGKQMRLPDYELLNDSTIYLILRLRGD